MARIDNINNFLTDVADSIRTKTGKSGKISASSFDTEIASITTSEDLDTELATYNTELTEQEESLSGIVEYLENKIESGEPLLLQDKSIEITENGTTNIVADEGYDGLNSVEVTTNVASSGGEIPEKGLVVNEWDNNGYATKVTVYGITVLPACTFGATSSSYLSMLGKSLTEVILPSELTEISSYAFAFCTSLVTAELPDTITTIRDNGFNGCSNLLLTSLPNNLTYIGTYGFYNCSKLAITSLPEGLKKIEEYTFNGCKNIEIKTLPSIQTIAQRSFQNCTSITQLSANNLTGVAGSGTGNGAFVGCSKLVAVWLGASFNNDGVTYRGAYGFYSSGLKRLYINRPRVEVEAISGYSVAWCGNANYGNKVTIICNDDEGWLTKEEFDAIDWSTYTL